VVDTIDTGITTAHHVFMRLGSRSRDERKEFDEEPYLGGALHDGGQTLDGVLRMEQPDGE
jgi:hypothetical protein